MVYYGKRDKLNELRDKMNQYQQHLVNEYGKEYTSKLMKWARKMVKSSDTGKNLDQMASEWETTKQINDDVEKYLIAIVAVKRDQYQGKMTVNLSDVTGMIFDKSDFQKMPIGMTEIFAVAQPYQFVFLLS